MAFAERVSKSAGERLTASTFQSAGSVRPGKSSPARRFDGEKLIGVGDDALGEQQPGGEVGVVPGRAHRDGDGRAPPSDYDNRVVIITGTGNEFSLADKSEMGKIHRGADDNASGTSSVIEIARVLGENKALLKRTVSGVQSRNRLFLHLPQSAQHLAKTVAAVAHGQQLQSVLGTRFVPTLGDQSSRRPRGQRSFEFIGDN